MRALLADPSARLRSWMGIILDRSGDLCVRLGARCFSLRQRLHPSPSDLTPAAADRLLAGVMTRIAADPPPPVLAPLFTPTAFEQHCAETVARSHMPIVLAPTAHGPRAIMVLSPNAARPE